MKPHNWKRLLPGARLARSCGRINSIQALQRFFIDESGQDLVEYALVATLISLGATASMSSVATALSTAFTNLGTKLGTYFT